MNYIQTLINQIIMMFIFVFLGLFMERKKMFSSHFNDDAGALLFKICAPVNVINSMLVDYSSDAAIELLNCLGLSIVLFGISILLSKFLLKEEQYPIEQYSAIISNCGFLGLPIVKMVCGSEYGFYAVAYILCNIVIQMTYGVYIVSNDKKNISFKAIVTNTSVLGCLFGLVCYFLRLPIPTPVQSAFSGLSGLVAPISCVLIGVNLSKANLKNCFKKKSVYLGLAIRHFVIPMIGLVLMKFVSNDYYLIKLTMLIVMSTPAAAGLSVFARTYNKDFELASALACVSTLFTILSMPIMTSLALMIW